MRVLLAALFGLILVTSPALAARGSDRGQAAQPRAKVTAPAPSVASAAQRRAPRATAPRAAALRAAPVRASQARGTTTRAAAPASASRRSVSPVRSARAATPAHRQAAGRTGRATTYASTAPAACRGNARNCRLVRVSAPQPMRWSQGLSPALNVQASNCPAGTMATLATGHANVVRCMPI